MHNLSFKSSLLGGLALAVVIPFSMPVSAQAQADGSFKLVTMFLEKEGKCFDGGTPEGIASQTDCATAKAPRWRAIAVSGGKKANTFQLASVDAPGKCLEGARGVMEDHHNGGAAYLTTCGAYTGQYWHTTDNNGEYFRLRNEYADDNSASNGQRCLEGNRLDPNSVLAGASFMDTCQNVSGQFFRVSGGSLVNGIPQSSSAAKAQAGNDVASASATPEIPASTALQSCSVNNAACETSTSRGFYLFNNNTDNNRGRIQVYESNAAKPILTVEHVTLADGRVAVAFRDGSNKYLTVDDRNSGYPVSFSGTSANDAKSQFLSVPALDSPGAGFASFKSVAFQNRFLRHQGYNLFAHPSDNSSLFKRDASWRILNAN
ncbi:AbfB domain-containing protein [Pseudomonas sp. ABC1]|uniref:AbfB domain-containing protein n=1 Tax=Pseudomonas sp. ABC1 TaxID=2748080 RepID=UPI0015C2F1B4|nr:AbfB domain-containing protein [Pseudomonas sp. ABC1]QLF93180.1 AbfB domain-containing protein [Pseudomonas sp. ABC1]